MIAPFTISSRKASERLVSGEPNLLAPATYTNTVSAVGFGGNGALLNGLTISDYAASAQSSDTSCNCCGDDGYGNCFSCTHYYYYASIGATSFPNTGWYFTGKTHGFNDFAVSAGGGKGWNYGDGDASWSCCTDNNNTTNCFNAVSIMDNVDGACAAFAGISGSNGILYTWGYNGYGAVGDNTTINRSAITALTNASGFTSVRGGGTQGDTGFFVANKNDGTLWSWGAGLNAQLGLNSVTNRSSPVQIGSLTHWSGDFCCGRMHTLAVTSDGKLFAWGWNDGGQIGDNSTTHRSSPVQIGTSTNWKSVFAADNCSFAIKTDGTLWAWGSNAGHQLGVGTSVVSYSSPVQVGSGMTWKQVFNTSTGKTVGITTNGNMFAWGSNPYGISSGAYSSPMLVGSNNYRYHASLPQQCAVQSDTLDFNYNQYSGYLGSFFIDTSGNVGAYTGSKAIYQTFTYSNRRAKRIIIPSGMDGQSGGYKGNGYLIVDNN